KGSIVRPRDGGERITEIAPRFQPEIAAIEFVDDELAVPVGNGNSAAIARYVDCRDGITKLKRADPIAGGDIPRRHFVAFGPHEKPSRSRDTEKPLNFAAHFGDRCGASGGYIDAYYFTVGHAAKEFARVKSGRDRQRRRHTRDFYDRPGCPV